MKALIIEDDAKESNTLKKWLEQDGYTCTTASDGAIGYRKIISEDLSLAIVDLALPEMTGLEIIRKCREQNLHTPIIILSGYGDIANRISGLSAGADYFVTKPSHHDEISACIAAVMRRHDPTFAARTLHFDDISLNPLTREVVRNGHPIHLTNNEFKLLECLMRNPGRIVSPRTIIMHAWGYEAFPINSGLVEPRVYRLREKLMSFGGRDVIKNERTLGYKLK